MHPFVEETGGVHAKICSYITYQQPIAEIDMRAEYEKIRNMKGRLYKEMDFDKQKITGCLSQELGHQSPRYPISSKIYRVVNIRIWVYHTWHIVLG